MKIGVFDSGRGGEYIAEGLKKLLPEHEYLVVNDRAHVPYGNRTNQEVTTLTEQALTPLFAAHCPIIVIACNTATMASIAALREHHPETRFVGTEPMVKPASLLSTTQHITVLATPLTLGSERYHHLKTTFGRALIIDEPDTSGWAALIEGGNGEQINLSAVATSVTSGSDTIVLACTHYITLASRLKKTFPQVTVIEPTDAIARQISSLCAQIELTAQ